jgi:hypothetical protein
MTDAVDAGQAVSQVAGVVSSKVTTVLRPGAASTVGADPHVEREKRGKEDDGVRGISADACPD